MVLTQKDHSEPSTRACNSSHPSGSGSPARAAEAGAPRHYYPQGLAPSDYREMAVVDLLLRHPHLEPHASWIRTELAHVMLRHA